MIFNDFQWCSIILNDFHWFSMTLNTPGPIEVPYMAHIHVWPIYDICSLCMAFKWPIYVPYVANILVSNVSIFQKIQHIWSKMGPCDKPNVSSTPLPGRAHPFKTSKHIKNKWKSSNFDQWFSTTFNDVPWFSMTLNDFQHPWAHISRSFLMVVPRSDFNFWGGARVDPTTV